MPLFGEKNKICTFYFLKLRPAAGLRRTMAFSTEKTIRVPSQSKISGKFRSKFYRDFTTDGGKVLHSKKCAKMSFSERKIR